MSTHRRVRAALITALTLALLVPTAMPVQAATTSPEVRTISDGLVGPLGLAVGRHRRIHVAEAFAGRLTRVTRDGNETVFAEEGVSIAGGIAFDRHGRTVFTYATGDGEASPPNRAFLGRLRRDGTVRRLARLSRYEIRNNPDEGNTYGFVDLPDDCNVADVPDLPQPQPYPGAVDSNPYAVAAAPHGGFYVADAAGNSILKVRRRHHRTRIRTVAILPPVPQTVTADVAESFGLPACVVGHDYMSEPVPTDVEVGPGGMLYVSSLPGGPELPGTGGVFRINPRTGSVRRVVSGLSGAVDLAVDHHGRIYVAELAGNRISVVRGHRARPFVEVDAPGAVEVRHGRVYATINTFDGEAPGNGTVVVISPR